MSITERLLRLSPANVGMNDAMIMVAITKTKMTLAFT
jgi:hypothetical protein